MTKQQALTLIEHIEQDMPQVQASIEAGKFKDNYHLRLFLPCTQLYISINYAEDWPSIKQAWQWFLDGVIQEEKTRKQKHLVDGQPMYIFRDKSGYWRGTYNKDGHNYKRYFGKIDPRPNYPLYKKETQKEEVTV